MTRERPTVGSCDGFADWDALLALILDAFAYMDSRIDPPSSARLLTAASLERKSRDETAFLARWGDRLAGCAFVADRGDHFYLGKLAVHPALQGRGLGKALLAAVEAHALREGKPVIELQTRVELKENQLAFSRLGFHETERTAHAGYARPTSITMRKVLI